MEETQKIGGLVPTVLLVLSLILFSHSALHATEGIQTVRIVRDGFGVPHIYGTTDEAALYGFGYVQAEDHLLEMLQNYLAAEGRLAELFGRKFLSSDIVARAVLSYSDEELIAAVNPETVELVEAFAQGINRYIAVHRAELPDWAQDFEVTAAQVLRFAHYTMISRSLNAGLAELRGGASAAREEASNQWVVGDSRTEAGAPNLPHGPPPPLDRDELLVRGPSGGGDPERLRRHPLRGAVHRHGPQREGRLVHDQKRPGPR